MKKIIAIFLMLTVSSWALPKITDESSDANLPPIWQEASGKDSMRALKVAEIDALRKMAEKVYGFHIDGHGSVYDFMLENAVINNSVSAVVKGASKTGKPVYSKDGAIYVEYSLVMRKVIEVIRKEIVKEAGKTFEVTEQQIMNQDRLVSAMGSGALPNSEGLRKIRAKRAAELDAYSNMAARMMGIRINSTSTVRDMALGNDQIQTSICAYLRGVKLNSIKYSSKGCEVEMQLKIREVIETIETIGRRYKKGWSTTTENIVNQNRETVDRIFKVTGVGAFRDDSGTSIRPA
ncbi:MAG: LPP20 family lipoprotein, partial [Lentisphaeraceae bacterium]|nr:LPP20 family lipoprotein [Lentisphaeraceae bacterium]